MSRHTRLAWLALPVAMATLSACATWDPQVRALTRDPHLKGWVERCQAGDEAACQNARERVMHPFADLSKPGYAVFFENGAVYGRPTRAECEVSRKHDLDERAPRVAATIGSSVEPIREMLESHMSPCTHVRVSPSTAAEANYWIATGAVVWIGATTEAACREIVKDDGLECDPVRIDRQ